MSFHMMTRSSCRTTSPLTRGGMAPQSPWLPTSIHGHMDGSIQNQKKKHLEPSRPNSHRLDVTNMESYLVPDEHPHVRQSRDATTSSEPQVFQRHPGSQDCHDTVRASAAQPLEKPVARSATKQHNPVQPQAPRENQENQQQTKQ